MISRYRALDRVGRWYLLIYAVQLVWPLPYALATPYTTAAIFATSALAVWAFAATACTVVCIAALLRHDNLVVERWALWVLRWLLLVYPVANLVTIILELHAQGYSQRWHGLGLGVLPSIVLSARLQTLSTKVRHAQETPLPGEEDAA